MKPRQWMQIAAITSAMGLAGTAIAHGMDRTPGTSNDTSAAATSDNSAAAATLDGNSAATSGNNSATNDNDDLSGNASSSMQPDANGSAGAALNHGGDLGNSADVNGNPSLSNGTAPQDLNRQPDRGATQGSTMSSPRANESSDANAAANGARFGSGSSATTIGGQDRLGTTNSDRFDTSASDYTTQHGDTTPAK